LKSRLLRKPVGAGWTARAVVLLFVLGAAALACAQTGAMSPNQGESDGVGAGGNWLEFASTDKMTGESRVRFELRSDNYFKEDSEYKPRVNLVCIAGKLKRAEFRPGVKLGFPNRPPGWYGQLQWEVMVRVDDVHYHKGWNWLPDRSLSMDKETVRGLLGAQVFNVELPTGRGKQIAEFSPSRLNLDRVRQACDLTPKKPSKD